MLVTLLEKSGKVFYFVHKKIFFFLFFNTLYAFGLEALDVVANQIPVKYPKKLNNIALTKVRKYGIFAL